MWWQRYTDPAYKVYNDEKKIARCKQAFEGFCIYTMDLTFYTQFQTGKNSPVKTLKSMSFALVTEAMNYGKFIHFHLRSEVRIEAG